MFRVVGCCLEVVVVSSTEENSNTQIAEGWENAKLNDRPLAGSYPHPTSGESD